MRTLLAPAAALVLGLAATMPVAAQISGGTGGGVSAPSGGTGGAGSVGGGVGSPSATGGVGTSGGLGATGTPGASQAGVSSSVDNGIGGIDSGGVSTQERASEGSTTINSLNVDSIARDGGAGAATGLGGSGTSGAGANTTDGVGAPAGQQQVDIPRAPVAVDLSAIRRALEAGPSATPKADGR